MPTTPTSDHAHRSPQRHQKPRRGQLRGWRKPRGSVVITRPGRWSNPYRLREHGGIHTRVEAIALFQRDLDAGQLVTRPGRAPLGVADARRELAGRDLVCTCGLDEPCHGDVLLSAANQTSGSRLPDTRKGPTA